MKLHDTGVYLVHGVPQAEAPAGFTQEQAKQGTIAYGILKAHNTGDSMQDLRMKFDSMTSHDITYVGIIQTARASGMKEFPLPYVMTNCHNSLCAVGGTINEDDHQFALSAAHKYGGIYVPPNMAVIHSYNREMMSGCGRMILGSDSHTRASSPCLICLAIKNRSFYIKMEKSENYSTTARMSLWRTMVHSSPSTLTSVPEYLLVRTLSPTLTIISTSLPSTLPPGPTAMTSATWGFSLAEPDRIKPPLVVSSSSTSLMTTRSARGLIFIVKFPPNKDFSLKILV